MIRIREAIIVEGRYDKNTLAQVVDAPILETSGFGIFHDSQRLALLRRLAETRGIIVLTDSDGAGFVIRNYLRGAIDPTQVKHAYIPDVAGKERRKRTASKEGKLGVEGMRPEVLLEALRRAGATIEGEDAPLPGARITKADLYAAGLTGGADSRAAPPRLGFRLLYIIPYSTIPQARRICTKNFAVSGVFSPGYGDFQLFAQIPKRLARHERGFAESRVIDSRPAEEGATIRRRRECLACQKRFTTYEIIETLPLVVIKRDGSRQSFDKSKLINGMVRACDKRKVPLPVLEKIAGAHHARQHFLAAVVEELRQLLHERINVLELAVDRGPGSPAAQLASACATASSSCVHIRDRYRRFHAHRPMSTSSSTPANSSFFIRAPLPQSRPVRRRSSSAGRRPQCTVRRAAAPAFAASAHRVPCV